MQIVITTKWTYTQGQDVAFNCPGCKMQGAEAQSQETEEKNSLFWLIPLFATKYTILKCRSCGKSSKVLVPLEEVQTLDPDAISQNLEASVPFLIKFCIVAGIILFIIPFVGLFFGSIGLAGTIKKSSGWKKAAIVGMFLSLIPVIAMIIALALGG